MIGRIAFGVPIYDGQTIKTRVLIEELRQKYPNARINLADTYQYMKHPWKTLKNIFTCIKRSNIVFVLLSRNGMRVVFPIINFLNRFYRRPIFHDCIGGSLDIIVEKHIYLKKQLNCFDVNWVESPKLRDRLEKMGVRNVEYLPNFKRLSILSEKDLTPNNQVPYRFCTFSRVNEDKGIGRAAEAIIQINKNMGKIVASLDVYGPIEGNYGEVLEHYVTHSDGAVKYKGIADSGRSVEILKDYYALLFPTTFVGEGFPGTLIDALSAGLPVIATDWHCNSEIISHGYTGYIYSADEPEQLQRMIEDTIKDSLAVFEMRKNCLREAAKYDADIVMNVICEKIEQAVS